MTDDEFLLVEAESINAPKYYHEATDEELKTLYGEEGSVDVRELFKIYKKPDWCENVYTLHPNFFCWSLVDKWDGARRTIGESKCDGCDMSKFFKGFGDDEE